MCSAKHLAALCVCVRPAATHATALRGPVRVCLRLLSSVVHEALRKSRRAQNTDIRAGMKGAGEVVERWWQRDGGNDNGDGVTAVAMHVAMLMVGRQRLGLNVKTENRCYHK